METRPPELRALCLPAAAILPPPGRPPPPLPPPRCVCGGDYLTPPSLGHPLAGAVGLLSVRLARRRSSARGLLRGARRQRARGLDEGSAPGGGGCRREGRGFGGVRHQTPWLNRRPSWLGICGPRSLGRSSCGGVSAAAAAAVRGCGRVAERRAVCEEEASGGREPPRRRQPAGRRLSGARNNANLGDLCIPTRTRVAPLGIGCMFAVFRLSIREDTYSPHSVGSTRCRRSPLALTRLLRIHGAR